MAAFRTDGDVVRDLALRLGIISDFRGLESWDARVERTKKGLQGAADYANKFSAELGKLRDMAIYAAAGLAGGLTAVLGVTTAVANETAEHAVAVTQQAAALGLSTDAFQELSGAMGQMDIDQDQTTKLLEAANDAAISLASGNKESAKSFKTLGISAADLKGKSLDEVFARIAEGARTTTDSTQRLDAVTNIFGNRLGTRVLPFLLQGSDGIAKLRGQVRDLGGVMDSDAIATANRYDDALDALTLQVSGIRNEIGTAFLPALLSVVEAVGDVIQANRAWISTQITTWVSRLANFTKLAGSGIRFAARHSYALAAALTAAAAAGGALAAALAAFRVGSAIYYGLAGLASLFTAIGPAFSAMAGLSFEASTIAVLESLGATIVAFTGVSLGTIAGGIAVAVAVLAAAFAVLAAEVSFAAAEIVGAYLLLEDFYLFLTSNSNTVLGEFVAGWAKSKTTLGDVARHFIQLRNLALALMDVVRDLATLAGQSLQPVFDSISRTFDAVATSISNAVQSAINAVLMFNGIDLEPFTALLSPIIGMVRGLVVDLDRLVATGQGLGGLFGGARAQGAGFAMDAARSVTTSNNTTINDRSSTSVTVQSPDPLAAGVVVVPAIQRARSTGQLGIGGDR